MSDKFKVNIPAYIQDHGDKWKIYGLASTNAKDLQNEIVDTEGLDLSAIKEGKAIFNYDHQPGDANNIGVIETYKKGDGKLFLGGYLHKDNPKAQAIYQIMSVLNVGEKGRVGMSIEGKIKKREGEKGEVVKEAVINACALTLTPVNTDTYTDLIKSLNGGEVAFEGGNLSIEATIPLEKDENLTKKGYFSVDQVMNLIQKSMEMSDAKATKIPSERKGGDTMAKEDMKKKPKKCERCQKCKCEKPKKMLKKADSEYYGDAIHQILNELQILHPGIPRNYIWTMVKKRLETEYV